MIQDLRKSLECNVEDKEDYYCTIVDPRPQRGFLSNTGYRAGMGWRSDRFECEVFGHTTWTKVR